jgi:hypothetical protein
MEEEIEQFIEKKAEQGPEQIASEMQVANPAVNTVTDEEMASNIAEQENYKPVSEEDITAIRAEILKARITEIPDGTKIVDDDEKNSEWIKKQNEWNEKVRKEVEAMTDEEVIAWAKNLNEQFHSTVEVQKKDFEMYKSGEKFEGDANHDNDPVYKYRTPDQQRRHFLRITNPNRKRGDPISKEPESAHRFLKQCKFVRERMDFDKMSKLELKTRLIQTIASQCIQLSDLQEKHQNESETDARVWRIEVEKMESRALDLLSKLNYERECIRRFFEKHPGNREEYDLVCSKVKSEFSEPKIGDR